MRITRIKIFAKQNNRSESHANHMLRRTLVLSPEGKCLSTPDEVQLISLDQNYSVQITKIEVSKTPSMRRLLFQKPLLCGWMGGWVDGRTDDNLGPSIFFILIYIQHNTDIYLSQYKKMRDKFPVGLKFWSSWGDAPTILKITILRRLFSKIVPNINFFCARSFLRSHRAK